MSDVDKANFVLPREDQYLALADFSKTFRSLEGSTILEIGSDWDGLTLKALKNHYGASVCYGVNPEVRNPFSDNGISLLKKYGSNTGLPDSCIDFVFSHATFEHVLDIEANLVEIERVLKPNGKAWIRFGPVWSSKRGHHLWLKTDKQKFTFLDNVIPPYGHLLMEENELNFYLQKKMEKNYADAICFEVYHSQGINRFFMKDYKKKFDNSLLKLISFTKVPNTIYSRFYLIKNYWKQYTKLFLKYSPQDFISTGATAILEKTNYA